MATKEQINTFINRLAPLVQKYAKENGYSEKVIGIIIAQACNETGYGTDGLSPYHNFWGMKCGSAWKGKAVNKKTKEEYTPGQLTNITALFRAYDSDEEGVQGYFNFINCPRYSNLKKTDSAKTYAATVKADGWATDTAYTTKLMNIYNTQGLAKYDTYSTATVSTKPTTNETATNATVGHNNTSGSINKVSYYPKYNGTSISIVNALLAVGCTNTTLAYRRKIAEANGIKNYRGATHQNLEMIRLLKAGKLIKI